MLVLGNICWEVTVLSPFAAVFIFNVNCIDLLSVQQLFHRIQAWNFQHSSNNFSAFLKCAYKQSHEPSFCRTCFYFSTLKVTFCEYCCKFSCQCYSMSCTHIFKQETLFCCVCMCCFFFKFLKVKSREKSLKQTDTHTRWASLLLFMFWVKPV